MSTWTHEQPPVHTETPAPLPNHAQARPQLPSAPNFAFPHPQANVPQPTYEQPTYAQQQPQPQAQAQPQAQPHPHPQPVAHPALPWPSALPQQAHPMPPMQQQHVVTGGGATYPGHAPANAQHHAPQHPQQHVHAPQQHQVMMPQHAMQQLAPGWSYPVPGHAQQPVAHRQHSSAPRPTGAHRSRLRWENIFPLLTIIALVVAGVLFYNSWPFNEAAQTRPTSATSKQDAGTGATKSTTPSTSAAMSSKDIAVKLTQVRRLIASGSYAQAGLIMNALQPMAGAHPQIRQMSAVLNRAERLNARVTRQLGRQVASGNWAAASATLTVIRRLRPLNAQERRIQARVTKQLAAARANRQITHGSASGSGSGSASTSGSGSNMPNPQTFQPPTGNSSMPPPMPGSGNTGARPTPPPGVAAPQGGGQSVNGNMGAHAGM